MLSTSSGGASPGGFPPVPAAGGGTANSWNLQQVQQAQQGGQEAEDAADEAKGERIGESEAAKWEKKVEHWEQMQKQGEGEEYIQISAQGTAGATVMAGKEEERSVVPAFIVLSMACAMVCNCSMSFKVALFLFCCIKFKPSYTPWTFSCFPVRQNEFVVVSRQ